MITTSLTLVQHLITQTLEQFDETIEVALTSRNARRALNARHPVVFIAPPNRITYQTANIIESEFTLTTLSPSNDVIEALEHAATITHALHDTLDTTSLEPDIYTIDGGEPIPGVATQFTLTMEIQQ